MTYAIFLYYLNGMCTMFFGVMAFQFWCRRSKPIFYLMAVLMLVTCLGYIKDVPFIDDVFQYDYLAWQLITAADMIVIPLYVAVLTELCQPGTLSVKKIIIHEIPFILLPLLFLISKEDLFYGINVVWGAIYGMGYGVWTLIAIPRYHKQLKKQFSYQENINLNWLRIILCSFFGILTIWTIDSFGQHLILEGVYIMSSLITWMFICYFIHRHEFALNELTMTEPNDILFETEEMPKLGGVLQELFIEQKLFLNPRLKLSDVALQAGTNRTYLSNYFNQTLNTTFYDYVNGLRLDHAEQLLLQSSDSQTLIAEQSGFNSLSTFRRQFCQRHHCTPEAFRQHHLNKEE